MSNKVMLSPVLKNRKTRGGYQPLTVTHPQLAAQWHPLFNGGIKAEDLTYGSTLEAWWLCPRQLDHVFQMSIVVRATSTASHKACPFCRGDLKSIIKPLRRPGRKYKKSILETHLAVAAQWDFEKNGWWVPEDFTAGSSFEAWWNCPLGHNFQTMICYRTGTRCLSMGCADCGELAKQAYNRDQTPLSVTHPELSEQWDWDLNDLTPADVTRGSNRRVHWICPGGPDHQFYRPISRRANSVTASMACPFCAGKLPSVTNSLASLYPELTKEYSEKNKVSPESVVSKSGKKVWWRCTDCSHSWQATPAARVCFETGCPKCKRGDTLDISKNKKLMALFDQARNLSIDPKKVPVGTKVSFVCDEAPDHVFKAGVYRNGPKQKCPYCRGFKTSVSNSLATCHPALAKEWHRTLNGNLTPSGVRATSNKRVWWICQKGDDHEWQAMICTRVVIGTGCPFCKNKRSSVKNNITVTHPAMAGEFHPTKNSPIAPEDVVAGSGKTYWWRCQKGHNYQMVTEVKVQRGGECRRCKELKSPLRHMAKIKQLQEEGLSQSQIGRRLGLTRDSVRYVITVIKERA